MRHQNQYERIAGRLQEVAGEIVYTIDVNVEKGVGL